MTLYIPIYVYIPITYYMYIYMYMQSLYIYISILSSPSASPTYHYSLNKLTCNIHCLYKPLYISTSHHISPYITVIHPSLTIYRCIPPSHSAIPFLSLAQFHPIYTHLPHSPLHLSLPLYPLHLSLPHPPLHLPSHPTPSLTFILRE